MSVLSHLRNAANNAVLSQRERNSIRISIATISDRLDASFGADVSEHIMFGSYQRNTILPRSMDDRSDVDYMVVFEDAGHRPQTYLDRLRRFAEDRYHSSEVHQSNPTMVLELNHIKFDLVPAVRNWFGSLRIPAPASNFLDWVDTDPGGFNNELGRANQRCSSLLKPTIRLIKYWNAVNGHVFDSYELEQELVGQSFFLCENLQDYCFAAIQGLSVGFWDAQWRKDRDSARKGHRGESA